MKGKSAWKGKPNGQEPNRHKTFEGFNKGEEAPASQSDSACAGAPALNISAKHNENPMPEGHESYGAYEPGGYQ